MITGVGLYIGHLDPDVRICGMLVAEVVAQRAGGTLDFGVWAGDGPGKDWAKRMRQLISERDDDAETSVVSPSVSEQAPSNPRNDCTKGETNVTVEDHGDESDDSITGYAEASPSSSRAPSPTSSQLAELEHDPTLGDPGKKALTKPVYIIDLLLLLKVDKEGNEQAESIAIGLKWAAELIRRKRGFGFELGEHDTFF